MHSHSRSWWWRNARPVQQDQLHPWPNLWHTGPLSDDHLLPVQWRLMQVHGYITDAPVSPIVANLYVEEVESRALITFTGTAPWFRYVDDTWVKIRTWYIGIHMFISFKCIGTTQKSRRKKTHLTSFYTKLQKSTRFFSPCLVCLCVPHQAWRKERRAENCLGT